MQKAVIFLHPLITVTSDFQSSVFALNPNIIHVDFIFDEDNLSSCVNLTVHLVLNNDSHLSLLQKSSMAYLKFFGEVSFLAAPDSLHICSLSHV